MYTFNLLIIFDFCIFNHGMASILKILGLLRWFDCLLKLFMVSIQIKTSLGVESILVIAHCGGNPNVGSQPCHSPCEFEVQVLEPPN